jgi:polyisoprenyl-phosphate glycosyltransferase
LNRSFRILIESFYDSIKMRNDLDVFLAMPEMHRFVRGMVAWIGMKQLPFVYDRQERFAGTTKYPLRKMLKLTFDAITGFSTAPLKLASYLGFLLAIAGLCAIGYALWGWYTGANIPGWTSLMSVVLLASSAQMFVLGIFGEYLGRLYMQSKQRPLFTIQTIERQKIERQPGVCHAPSQETEDEHSQSAHSQNAHSWGQASHKRP